MVSLLSQYSMMVSDGMTLSSTTNFLNQNTSLVASEAAMYSIFMVEFAMTSCLKLFQLTNPPLHRKIYLNVDLLSSISDMKFESMYPSTFNSDLPPKIKNESLVLLKYLRMFFIAINTLHLDSIDICL